MENIADNPKTQEEAAENEDWDEDEDYSDDGLDAEAEAEAIARRLNEQLWADIAKAQADAAASASAAAQVPATPAVEPPAPAISLPSESPYSRKQYAAILTIKAVIQYAEKDALFRSTLSNSSIPDKGDVFSILTRCAADGVVAKGLSKPLAQLMVTLARSDTLFSSIKNSDASVIELEKGKNKRKREAEAESAYPSQKRPFYTPDYESLSTQVQNAVLIITDALSRSMPTSPRPVDASLIASVQVPLHQIFLFAVTSSSGTHGQGAHLLQEIGGLIQVLGVLSGIQIGQHPGVEASSDIGTAVYRCLLPSCNKTFIRLYSLRAHQRLHSQLTAQGDRPYQCNICPATFARNHDLKRHMKLHESKAYKCLGCNKTFSRRDALKRHKNAARGKGVGKGEECVDAEVVDVDLEEEEDARKVRMYAYPSAQQGPDLSGVFEEGQIGGDLVGELQLVVTRLHPLLQEYVTKALGTQPGQLPPPPASTDLGAGQGQTTLASVIARVQQQNNIPGLGEVGSANVHLSQSAYATYPDAAPQAHAADFSGPSPQTDIQQPSSLAMYGLSEEQTRLLEQAIANAATAAQAQAEAEAAMEEEDEDGEADSEDEAGGEQA
ncbi:hypothetical protein GLOTRDRAFT_140346 [Gloeophyllum trabeum ATCC 11539]|uniref:C2H2-type domain-containing protein n=1 Tax=Gloeophyllum trabeum (strain ATCC 11539 / FP-39264 / Madison 617) TaxID=670483 RepID=S7PZH4_GLOTA|nr:uncharacterized protein GLOTRDRAFT_140346 [Gloeophyllum trabeum ATCC 11539]EPQ52702.1 hypothetical protein GLOTRDRAFT_140346 [Gloeophyllum trabeum ATCC 11539]